MLRFLSLPGWVVELVVNAAAAAVITSGLLPGIRIEGNYLITLLAVSVVFAVINVVIKPILKLLACPLIFFTLGAIILVIDGAMLLVTALLSDLAQPVLGGRLVIDNLLWAIVGALIMGVIEAVLSWLLERRDPRPVLRGGVKNPRADIGTTRAQADSQFDSLLSDEPARRTREGDGSRFDFYDPDK
jgi:putative membrane protein